MSTDLQFSDAPAAVSNIPPEGFFALFEAEPEPERKIRLAIDYMRSTLAQANSPDFKHFWEARRVCLPLFKANLNAKSRSLLWAEYVEISNEARHLKDILDAQSAFAVEQIELAINSLEKELADYGNLLSQFPSVDFPENCHILQTKRTFYVEVQKELNFLNTFASRINVMRKEVIKTEMRIRHKNKFFEQLSAAGDLVFPKRKELIKNVSEEFMQSVAAFIQAHFSEVDETPLFILREDIKALQSFAKMLTLNTQAFSETRLSLSECWDQLKEREKERKKEVAAKKVVFKQNFDLVMEKIQELAKNCAQGINPEDEKTQVNAILELMKGVELGREEVKALRDAIQIAREPLLQQQKEEELKRQEQAREFEKAKKAKQEDFKTKFQTVISETETLDLETLLLKKEELLVELEQLGLSKVEKPLYERLFKQLKEKIEEKREAAILNLSEADQQTLVELKNFLEERKQERLSIKSSLENYRKLLGGSGFDFEKAMQLREMMENEKARLDKINVSIEEVEDKLAEITSI